MSKFEAFVPTKKAIFVAGGLGVNQIQALGGHIGRSHPEHNEMGRFDKFFRDQAGSTTLKTKETETVSSVPPDNIQSLVLFEPAAASQTYGYSHPSPNPRGSGTDFCPEEEYAPFPLQGDIEGEAMDYDAPLRDPDGNESADFPVILASRRRSGDGRHETAHMPRHDVTDREAAPDDEPAILSDRQIEKILELIIPILREAMPVGRVEAPVIEELKTEITDHGPPAAASLSDAGDLTTEVITEPVRYDSFVHKDAVIGGGNHNYGEGSVGIAGTFTPDKLTCGDLTVLEDGILTGDISSSGIVCIFGKVTNSQILAKEVLIYSTGEIRGGGVKADSIGIQVGAKISANITTDSMRNEPA